MGGNKKQRRDIEEPAVIGAVLQLGYCCDLLDSKYIKTLKRYYELMTKRYSESGLPLQVNRDIKLDEHKDKILRELDCAVIQFMHSEIFTQVQIDEAKKGFTELKQFDSVRGAFTEGGAAYTGAGILEKTHIQICVRNLNCVKGFFKLRKEIDFRNWLHNEYKETV